MTENEQRRAWVEKIVGHVRGEVLILASRGQGVPFGVWLPPLLHAALTDNEQQVLAGLAQATDTIPGVVARVQRRLDEWHMIIEKVG